MLALTHELMQYRAPFNPRYLSPIPHIHTLVHTQALAQLLSTHPDSSFAHYVCTSFHFGFSAGYNGPRMSRHARNLSSAFARPQVISDYLAAECAAGNTAGPFPTPPLPAFIVSPLEAVSKKRNKWRLIMHLTFPPRNSVNYHINIEDFPLRYASVYNAMDSVMRLERGACMAKSDIKSAFRLCPVRPEDHHLLGMHWQGKFFFDRVLPFGLRSAPYIFNSLASSTEWLE